MRGRHKLYDQVTPNWGIVQSYTGADFTLEQLVEVGLDQHADLVGDISSAASKELAIELVSVCVCVCVCACVRVYVCVCVCVCVYICVYTLWTSVYA